MQEILRLVSNVINNKDEKISISNELYKIASFHSLAVFLKPNMDENTTSKEIIKKVNEDYFLAIKRDTIQLEQLNTLLNLFEENGIDCLPLKGSVIKHLYPDSFYRIMGDIDILVKEKDFKKARKIIESLNYKSKFNTEHHLEFEKPPFMIIELHRMLIEKKELGANLFKDIFARSSLVKNYKHIYQMSKEDFYLFMMCHLLKHYYLGGTGIRSFLDIYVYLNTYPNLDFNYIDDCLKKTKYYQDAVFIKNLSLKMFEDTPLDEKENKAINAIFSYGTYGRSDILAKGELESTNNNANKVIFKKIFPSVSSMKNLYPILKKCILLLPFTYIARIFHLLFNFQHSYARSKELKKIEKENKKRRK